MPSTVTTAMMISSVVIVVVSLSPYQEQEGGAAQRGARGPESGHVHLADGRRLGLFRWRLQFGQVGVLRRVVTRVAAAQGLGQLGGSRVRGLAVQHLAAAVFAGGGGDGETCLVLHVLPQRVVRAVVLHHHLALPRG